MCRQLEVYAYSYSLARHCCYRVFETTFSFQCPILGYFLDQESDVLLIIGVITYANFNQY